jgi:cytochrome P450
MRNTVNGQIAIADLGPVVRLSPEIVDIAHPEVARVAWAGQNEEKVQWDKEPEFCHLVKCGLKVDNVLSIADPAGASRMRRLIGAPFAKKFLLDHEGIFKDCTKNMIEKVEQLRKEGNVDVALQFKKYAFDILSRTFLEIAKNS